MIIRITHGYLDPRPGVPTRDQAVKAAIKLLLEKPLPQTPEAAPVAPAQEEKAAA